MTLEQQAVADQVRCLREEAAALDDQARAIKLTVPGAGYRALGFAFAAAEKRKLAKRLEQRAQEAVNVAP